MMGRTELAAGSLLGLLGVALGAFGAHGLGARLEGATDAAKRLDWWGTAAQYHLLHAVAIVAVASALGGARGGRVACRCFAAGIVVFSGTLYAMALGGPRGLGAVTPLGGVLLMLGWLAAALAAFRAGASGGTD